MQAELCGIALALAPGLACYVPLGHRRAGDGDMFGGGARTERRDGYRRPTQIPLDEALARLKPLLENPAVLKIGQNIKNDWLVLRPPRHRDGTARRHDADVLRARRRRAGTGHGLEGLCKELLAHEPIDTQDRHRHGQRRASASTGCRSTRRPPYAAEDADVTLRLWRVLKPRLAAERVTRVYERLERPLVPVLARMEQRGIKVDRQILSRLSGKFAQKAGGGGGGDLRDRRRELQHRLAEAARRHPVRQDGPRRAARRRRPATGRPT